MSHPALTIDDRLAAPEITRPIAGTEPEPTAHLITDKAALSMIEPATNTVDSLTDVMLGSPMAGEGPINPQVGTIGRDTFGVGEMLALVGVIIGIFVLLRVGR